jgi:diguanylate cyclase (GGDEF)-like protein
MPLNVPLSRRSVIVAVAVGLVGVFIVDRTTGSLPFEHLYYLPIILAALHLGQRGALLTSLAAVGLYHLANPPLLSFSHGRGDIVEIVLFFVVGAVAARLRDDARHQEAIAGTDDLTGLYNLRGFEQRLLFSVRTSRASRTPLSLLVLDIDHLKALNDLHGHLAGAEAVRTVGRIIARHLPETAFACRYGGDEFVLALPGLSAPAAQETASALLRAVRSAAPVLAGIAFPSTTLSISIGIASLHADAGLGDGIAEPDDYRDGEALFRAADTALYKAKRAGRGRVCLA